MAEAARRPRVWLRWVRIVVALGLVAFLGWRADITDLARGSIDWRLVALAAALVPLSILVRAYNHALLLNRPQRILSLRQAYVLTLAGIGINLVLPTGAADLAKAHWGWRMHGNAEAMVVSAVLDKLTSLTALAAVAVIGGLIAHSWVTAGALGILLVATFVPFVAPRAVPWRLLLRFLAPGTTADDEMVAAIASPPAGVLAFVYCVSLTGWAVTFGITWLCFLAVGADVSLAQIFAFAPLSSLARLVPVSFAGIGVGEVTMAALVERVGVPADAAALGVLLVMVLLTIAPGAVGAIVVARGRDD